MALLTRTVWLGGVVVPLDEPELLEEVEDEDGSGIMFLLVERRGHLPVIRSEKGVSINNLYFSENGCNWLSFNAVDGEVE